MTAIAPPPDFWQKYIKNAELLAWKQNNIDLLADGRRAYFVCVAAKKTCTPSPHSYVHCWNLRPPLVRSTPTLTCKAITVPLTISRVFPAIWLKINSAPSSVVHVIYSYSTHPPPHFFQLYFIFYRSNIAKYKYENFRQGRNIWFGFFSVLKYNATYCSAGLNDSGGWYRQEFFLENKYIGDKQNLMLHYPLPIFPLYPLCNLCMRRHRNEDINYA